MASNFIAILVDFMHFGAEHASGYFTTGKEPLLTTARAWAGLTMY